MQNRLSYLVVFLVAAPVVSRAAEPIFVPVKIDGPVHDPARHSYWFGPFSECASVLDVNDDGHLDIACGRNWYQGPNWTKHEDFRDGAATIGPETDDNSELALDVNRDGLMDVVSSGWLQMKGAFWYENPGRPGVKWKATRIHAAEAMEGVIHGDIDGDGDEDILVNHWSLKPGQGVTWLESIDREPWLKEHVIGTEGDTHGNGLGDINGDGRLDVVTPVGWYEAPPRPAEQKWTFHDDYRFHTAASHPILVIDANEDGANDIILGAGHDYGLVWLEQVRVPDGARRFEQHWIERDYGQFHTMELGDVNQDGKLDLVTGKRLFAHHGTDNSAFDPLFVFWYDISGGAFVRHILSFNHLPFYPGEENHNPPPNYVIGVGMSLEIVDLNKDGRTDIVVSGKGGLYVFFNQGPPPSPRDAHKLPPREEYTGQG